MHRHGLRRRGSVWTIALAVTVGVAGRAAETRGDLTGAWRINHEASDHGGAPGGGDGPEDAPPGRPPGGGPGGHGHGGGGRGGFGGGMGGPGGSGHGEAADREKMRERMEEGRAMMEAAERLTITQADDLVTIVDAEGRIEKLAPNGTKEKHLVGNTQAEVRTKWDEGRLVSEISIGDGLKFTRTLSIEKAGDGTRHLLVEVAPKGEMGGRRPPLKRVYDLIE